MREPVPPARMRKPVLPNPVNSLSEVGDDWSDEVVARVVVAVVVALVVVGREIVMALLDAGVGRNAAENGNIRRSWNHNIIILRSRCESL